MSPHFAKDRRLAFLSWGVGSFFLAAGISQARVHWFGRDDVLAQARGTKRFVVERVDFARRGTIFDANHEIIAQSDDTFELGLDFSRVPKSPGFFVELGHAAGLPASVFQQAALGGKRSQLFRDPIASTQAKAIRSVKEKWRADGVSLRRVLKRSVPLGEAVAGFVGSVLDGRAAGGLEMSQDQALRGTDGRREGLIDRTGAFLPMRMSDQATEKVDGKDISLTIVSELQIAATSAIRRAVEQNKADSGVAIIMNPKTGDILAMANWPTFDPESPFGAPTANPCYMGIYEPGSTFKILTLALALDRGKVVPSNTIQCRGELRLNSAWRVRCDLHHGTRAHGLVDAERAIAKSCNVSAATWALRVGYDGVARYLEDLGLLEKPGLGLPLEVAGQFNRNEYAKPLQIATVGFGQSLSATPIALASAFSMIANDGVRMKPRLITKIGSEDVPVVEKGKIVSAGVADIVLRLMESVISSDEGTGAKLRIPGYRLAGKTGTAQKIGGEKSGGHVSSFVGFVPAQEPRATVLVMVDNPKAGQYYGGLVAGPAFNELARRLISYYGLPPTEPIPSSAKAAPPKDKAVSSR